MDPRFSNADEALVYYTEANLATLETLCERKRTSMTDLDRQTGICLGMLRVVKGDVALPTLVFQSERPGPLERMSRSPQNTLQGPFFLTT
jgi:hypothetical protein